MHCKQETAVDLIYSSTYHASSRSPDVVVDSVVRLVKLALDLDTGTVHSTTVPIILYVIRLAARVQNYIKFLIDYATNKHESIRIDLRDVVVFPEILDTLEQGSAKVSLRFCSTRTLLGCSSYATLHGFVGTRSRSPFAARFTECSRRGTPKP